MALLLDQADTVSEFAKWAATRSSASWIQWRTSSMPAKTEPFSYILDEEAIRERLML